MFAFQIWVIVAYLRSGISLHYVHSKNLFRFLVLMFNTQTHHSCFCVQLYNEHYLNSILLGFSCSLLHWQCFHRDAFVWNIFFQDVYTHTDTAANAYQATEKILTSSSSDLKHSKYIFSSIFSCNIEYFLLIFLSLVLRPMYLWRYNRRMQHN